MKGKNNIDERLRSKMENFQKSPPPEVWDGILQRISREKKKPLIPIYLKYAAGIAALIALGTIFILVLQNEPDLQTQYQTERIENSEKLSQPSSDPESEVELKSTTDPELSTQKITAEVITPASEPVERKPVLQAKQVDESGKITSGISEEKTKPEEEIHSIRNEIIAENLQFVPSKYHPVTTSDTKLPLGAQTQRQYSWDDLAIDEPIPSNDIKERQIFSIAAIASPIYSYRDLGSVSTTVTEYFNESESGMVSYSGGIDFGIRAGKRLSFHSGLVYSKLGVSVNNILAVAEFDNALTEDAGGYRDATSPYIVSNSIGSIERSEKGQTNYEYTSLNSQSKRTETASNLNYMNSAGFYDPASNYVEDEGSLDQYFEYLEVPFLVKYVVIDRKLDLKLLGGLSTNFLVGNSVIYNEGGESTSIGSTSNIRTVSYSGNVGIGLDYDLRKRLRFILEPQFKYYLNSINSSSLITNRPYAFGLYTGFLFEF